MLTLKELLIRGDLRHFWRQNKTLPNSAGKRRCAAVLVSFASKTVQSAVLYIPYPNILLQCLSETRYVTLNKDIYFHYKKYVDP